MDTAFMEFEAHIRELSDEDLKQLYADLDTARLEAFANGDIIGESWYENTELGQRFTLVESAMASRDL